MANNRARIERRDDARRAYKKVAGILLKTIDERGKDFFPRDKNITNEFRKTFVEGIREFILAVDRVDDIDDQIILFRESILVLIPALMAGYSRARVYIGKNITDFRKKNSEAARSIARQIKIVDMKEIKEYSILSARNYFVNNPEFKGTRNALVVQIKPEIDKLSDKLRGKTISGSAITKYMKDENLP